MCSLMSFFLGSMLPEYAICHSTAVSPFANPHKKVDDWVALDRIPKLVLMSSNALKHALNLLYSLVILVREDSGDDVPGHILLHMD